jgi:hypothetical protein
MELGAAIAGVPTTIDGEQVFMGNALRAEIDGRANPTPFLAGGWFRAIDDMPFSCPLFDPPPQFRTCRAGFRLHDARTGPWRITLAINDPPRFDRVIATTQERPVVLRIHTHDPACATYLPDDPVACARRPVLDQLVWLGAVESEPPSPTVAPTQPTGGLSRREAIDLARVEVASVGGFRFPVVCTRIRLHSESLGGLDGDRDPWLWIVAFDGETRHNSVALDYFSGKVLMYEAGTGKAHGCDESAGVIG